MLETLARKRNSSRFESPAAGSVISAATSIGAASVAQHPRTPSTDETGHHEDGKVQKNKQKKTNKGEKELGYACTAERKN